MKDEKDIFDHLKPKGFEMPDKAYFEQLTKNVIESQQPVKPKVVPFYRKPVTWISAAAAVAIAIFITFTFSGNVETSNDPLLALNEITQDEIIAYVDQNIDEFETESIAEIVPESSIDPSELIPEEVVEETTQTIEPEVVSLDEIDQEEILEYLEVEGLDPSDLEDDFFM